MSPSLATRLFISACAFTGTTDLAAARKGAAYFLPALFAQRYANMGGLDRAAFARQLDGVRSFRDDRWCGHWNAIAAQHVAVAERALEDLIGSPAPGLLDAASRVGALPLTDAQTARLAPAALHLADHGPQPQGTDPQQAGGPAAVVLDAWLKAITYYQISAFPGHSPARTRAYWRSRRLFDALLALMAPAIGLGVEEVEIPVEGDLVHGYLVLPPGPGPHPTVLVTNGLEGTTQELLIPLMRYRDDGIGVFVMEMPGTYASHQPMSADSQQAYHRVIDHLVADPRVDADRLGVVGVSFGGYWSTRLAATDPRLRCAVACGALTYHSFQTSGSLGMPQAIIQALRDTTGATSLLDLGRKLRALSLKDTYADIDIPLLVINGADDTLASPQDSIDLAERARDATLLLYPDDDHCAMGHYRDWLDESRRWLHHHLTTASPAPR
ncbi:alpha/beta hydrolase family protein [Actinokineospora bangkokensis]|uniref:Alpha/beta hydrolase n=1 Tax=Actinokineospora bangkokensis TaxID=1193682 RepID=A0A1Q9LNY7_9PSEU|nr:alpha/beta hydrolase [Actinokineospora bangkokensis]OLR93721.1 hypothetical protein BJP25_15810 [Actinokineospora bangkokensis]